MVVEAGKWGRTAADLLEVYMEGFLAFLVDWSGFSNFECRNCQMEHSLVVYPDSEIRHSLDSFPYSDHLTDSGCKKVGMKVTHLLSKYYADFSFPSHPTSELKWLIFLSSVYPQKLYEWTPPGNLSALILHPPLDEVHPMPLRFQLHSSRSL